MSLFWRTRRQLSYSSVLYISQCSTFRDLFKYSVQAWIDSDIHRIDGYPVDNCKWDHYCTIHWMVIYLVDSTIQLVNNWALMLFTYIESLSKTLSHGLQDKSTTVMVMIDFVLSTKFFLSFQCGQITCWLQEYNLFGELTLNFRLIFFSFTHPSMRLVLACCIVKKMENIHLPVVIMKKKMKNCCLFTL